MDDENVGGQIQGINIASFLQMNEMEKTTCTLTVRGEEGQEGTLYLLEGQLIAAETGKLRKEEAAYEIISWDDSVIDVENSIGDQQQEINTPLMNILMEGLKVKEDKEKNKKTSSSKSMEDIELAMESETPPPPPKPSMAAPKEAPTKGEVEVKDPDKKGVGRSFEDIRKKRAKKKMAVILSIVVVIVVLCVVGAGVWIGIIMPMQKEKEFSEMMKKVSRQKNPEKQIQILEKYIQTHEGSKFIPKAEKKIKACKNAAEERDFKALVEKVDKLPINREYKKAATTLYSKFLLKYPKGARSSAILERITGIPEIVDDSDYAELEKVAMGDYGVRLEAYQQYLKFHPNGKYRDNVEKKIRSMGEEYYIYLKKEINSCKKNRTWDTCIGLCDSYAESFTNTARLAQVKKWRSQMTAEIDFTGLITQASEKGADFEGRRKVFSDYLKENPASPVKSKIRAEIAKADNLIKKREEWKKLSEYCKNKNIDVFERVKKLELYIKRNPSGRYIKKAKAVMPGLQKEKKNVLHKRAVAKKKREDEQKRLNDIAREKARIKSEQAKMTSLLRQSKGRYVVKKDMVTDTRTNLTWCILDSKTVLKKCSKYDDAVKYVKELKTGGHSDWRLPTSNELLVIYLNQPIFPASGAKMYWSSNKYHKGSRPLVKVVKSAGDGLWQKGDTVMEKCGSVRAVRP